MFIEKETKKGKPVSLLELFFDLVFVYAVAKMTKILENPVDGIIGLESFGLYILAALVILQVWLYQTNYNNRFASGRWYENLTMLINMATVLFISNVLGAFTKYTILDFDIAMIIMLGAIGTLYRIVAKSDRAGNSESLSFSRTLYAVVFFFVMAAILIITPVPNIVSYFVTGTGVVVGAFLPFLVRRNFSADIVDFPHLTERFELLTIVTFGEMVASVGAYFMPDELSFVSIFAFVIIISFFGFYVVHNHYVINRKADTRGLVLMISHYFIAIALNIMTVGQTLVRESEINTNQLTVMMLLSTLVFFGAVLLNSVYYCRKVWSRIDIAIIISILTIGSAGMLIAHSGYGCLFGMFFMSVAMFFTIFIRAKQLKVKCRE